MRSLLRTIKFAAQNSLRNFWLSVITVFILTLTLFSIGLLTTLNYVASQAIAAVVERVDVNVFFTEETAEADVFRAQSFLEKLPEVSDVTYISQKEALENFSEEHRDDAEIQETLKELEGETLLPASLTIKARNLNSYPTILTELDNSEFNAFIKTRNFESYHTIIQRLQSIIDRLTQIGIIVSCIFGFIAILVIFNTVRITIYTHREEIGIMKLVGATNGFIRAPFMLEGVFYAILASVLTLAIFYPIVRVSAPYINTFLEGYQFDLFYYFKAFFWQIFGIQLLIALVLSIGSSMVAIGRHLRV